MIATLAGPAAGGGGVGGGRPAVDAGDRGFLDELEMTHKSRGFSREEDYRNLAGPFDDRQWRQIEAVALALLDRGLLTLAEIGELARTLPGNGQADHPGAPSPDGESHPPAATEILEAEVAAGEAADLGGDSPGTGRRGGPSDGR